MRCPECGSPYSKTLYTDKRNSDFEDRILRARKCDECGYIFNTVEIIEESAKIDPFIPEKPKNNKEYEFLKHKKDAAKAAKELCYGQIVVDKIQEATDIYEIDRIMKAARDRI